MSDRNENDERDNKIRLTKNYRLFHLDDKLNRELDVKKHKFLMESMKEYGFLPEFPIVVYRDSKNRLVVKDGQHRLAIAETLGLPVAYKFRSRDWNTAKVNSTGIPWKLVDYALNWIANGKSVYQEGLEFQKQHGLTIGNAFALLAGTTSFNNCQTQFKNGEFKIKDRAYADEVASLFSRMSVLNPDALRKTTFLDACMSLCRVPEFDPRRLIEQADRKCRHLLVPFATKDAYLKMSEDIYNFGRKQTIPLKFMAEQTMNARNATVKAKAEKAKKKKGDEEPPAKAD